MPETDYRLADFDFALPSELIAQTPPAQRGDSRLLQVTGSTCNDLQFASLPSLLGANDLLVFNDTRVIKARIHARKSTGGSVELLLERIVADDEAWAQLRASHPPRQGAELQLPGGARALVLARDEGFFHLRFVDTGPLPAWLERHGEVPLPPYIVRSAHTDDDDRYQTVYARAAGAVAAPTAGLHFDHPLLAALAAKGIAQTFVTLHVGAGTFRPVQSEDLALHRMHREWFRIPADATAAIAHTRAAGGRVVAVGTTSLRALESAAALSADGTVAEGTGDTALFVRPGFHFRVVDRLLTNFHLPKSTLLMLVSAFAGYDNIRHAYAHAIKHRYRFFSYGDAMLLDRVPSRAPD